MKAPNYRLATPSETKCLDCVWSYKNTPRGCLECDTAGGPVTGKHTCDDAMLFEYEEDEPDEDQLRLEANAEARMENDRDLQIEDGAA